MTAGGSTIDYEALAQDAMRGVVRTVLTRAAKSGLPGDHHFYVSFDTEAPGVALSKRLREKYPQEMTIVLQHRFWDLSVSEDRFEVKLTFDGIPERLVVPFAAIKVFFDPSVRYGLQFEEPATEATSAALHSLTEVDPDMPQATTTRSASPRKPRAQKKPRSTEKIPPANLTAVSTATPPAPGPATVPAQPRAVAEPMTASNEAENKPAAEKSAAPAAGAQIVSLDQFRKK